MLRLGAAQVKQVAHRAPNENPSRAPAMPDATPQVVYMTCRAFMRRSADLTGGRRASLRSSARTCTRPGRCPRFVEPGFRPCSLHRITFRFRAAVGARIILFSFVPTPNEGWAERREARTGLLSRWRGATTALATRGASRCDRDGATRRSTVAISGRGTTLHLRQCGRIHVATGPRPGRNTWLTGSRTSRAAVRAAASGRHSPLRLQDRLRRRPSRARMRIYVA
jgi:hypothetical protein